MTRVRAKTVLVKGARMWAAVASAVRVEMIEQLRVAGPCSVAELADLMDRPADGLYHHLRLLESVGIIDRIGERDAGTRKEALFDLAAERLSFDADFRSGRGAKRYERVAAALLRSVDRRVTGALAAGGLEVEGPAKSLWMRIETSWLDDAELARVNEHLMAVEDILARARTQRHGRMFSFGIFVCPVVRTGRSDGNRGSRK
jgi:DNA-binding transcriptional ArsR family regulator